VGVLLDAFVTLFVLDVLVFVLGGVAMPLEAPKRSSISLEKRSMRSSLLLAVVGVIVVEVGLG
jgi:hypothetical protein